MAVAMGMIMRVVMTMIMGMLVIVDRRSLIFDL
jgi:hypothetical protein